MKRTFPLVVETDEKGGFSAFFPDVTGCAAAGDSLEECLNQAKEAVGFHLDAMLEDGVQVPLTSQVEDLNIDDDINMVKIAMITVELQDERRCANQGPAR